MAMEKRIMIITRLLTSGGAERTAANLATEMAKTHKVWLVVFDGNGATYSCRAPIIDLKTPMQKGIIHKAEWYIRTWKRILNLKKELKITHSISFLNEPDLINVLTAFRGKAIVSVRNKRSSLNKNWVSKIKDQWVFKKADRIISLSIGVKDDLVNFYKIKPDKIDVIYNPCDRERITTNANELTEVDFEKILSGHDVITAGRLTKQKGQWHLIRAFSRIVNEVTDAKLFILGQGKLDEYLEELINGLHLEEHVYILGYKENPYVYLTKCSLFVFSSMYEGFGNILLEAMACGLPIISTDCLVGPRELLAPGTSYNERTVDNIVYAKNGVLVPVCDGKEYAATEPLSKEEEIMANAIIEMLKNENLRKQYELRSQIRIKDFSDDSITKQWNDLLDILN